MPIALLTADLLALLMPVGALGTAFMLVRTGIKLYILLRSFLSR